MLLTKQVGVKWNSKNKKYYISKGYIFTKLDDIFCVSVEDLSIGSHSTVKVKCDCIDCNNPSIKTLEWKTYLRGLHDDGKYYCNKCAKKLYGGETMRLTLLENGKSFEQWCVENNRQDILERWDYQLNVHKPNEVGYGTTIKCYFKCPSELHASELKNINTLTSRVSKNMACSKCNSFAQWGITNICSDFLEKYWDYERNNESGYNPWIINRSSGKQVWIRCLDTDYHDSYRIRCSDFYNGVRCSYCGNYKVHHMDSLGYLYPISLKHWSDKNKKTPFEYSPGSTQKMWWKCLEGIHRDFKRSIKNSKRLGFRCPECQFSQGETNINNLLIKHKVYTIPQKEFDGLLGIHNGNLSYDFYLPQLNMLIEFQGEQHEHYIKGFHKSKKDFEKQQEHDRRKRQYAEDHKIKLLEIWYWDFSNIESILIQEGIIPSPLNQAI